MRGIVYLGDGLATCTDDLEVRAPGHGEVLVRIGAAGLCHTDVSVVDGTIPWPAPAVLGHEGAGVVEVVGEGVTSVAPGDHVVIATLANCGRCAACNAGHPTRCRSSIGNRTEPFTYRGEPCSDFAASSTLAERTVVKEIQLVRIDESVPLSSACLIACGVLTGAGSVWNAADVPYGATAAVFGIGGIGLNVLQALRVAGGSRVVAIDAVAEKEDLARAFGATDFVLAGAGDAGEAVRSLVPFAPGVGRGHFGAGGVDFAFECTGIPSVLRTAIDVLDWGGTAVVIGVPAPGTEVPVPVNHLVHLDRKVIGVRYGACRPQRDIPLIVGLYRDGRYDLDALVSATYPIEQWDAAVDDLASGRLARAVFTFEPADAHVS